MKQFFQKRIPVCTYGLIVLWAVVSFYWHLLDTMPFFSDQVFYAEGAVRIARNFATTPWLDFIRSLNDITNTLRPPGPSLLLAPLAAILHYDVHWIKICSLLWYFLMFWAIFQLGKKYFNKETGLLSIVFFLFLPQVYHLEVDPEVYQIILLPMLLLCLGEIWENTRRGYFYCFLAGVVASIGLLMKWVFGVYLIGPFLFVSWQLLKKAKKEFSLFWFFSWGIKILLAVVPVIFLSGIWYWINWNALAHSFSIYAQSREFTPFKSGWTWQALFFYPWQFLWFNKIFPLMVLMAGIVLSFLPASGWEKIRAMAPDEKQCFGCNLILSSLAGFLIYFGIRCENIPIKYMFPLLSVSSVLAVYWISRLHSKPVRHWIQTGLFVYGIFCVIWINFGFPTVNTIFKNPHNFYPDPEKHILWYTIPNVLLPEREVWPYQEIANAVCAAEKGNTSPEKMIVLPELYYFDWLGCCYYFLSSVPNVVSSPLNQRKGLENLYLSKYILASRNAITRYPYEERLGMPNAETAVGLGRYLDSAPAWFARHFRLIDKFKDFPKNSEMQLYQRVRNYSSEEIADLCNFWIVYNLGDPQAWPQIRALWRYSSHEEMGNRSLLFIQATDPANHEAWNRLLNADQQSKLWPYEKLQAGVWALQRNQAVMGERLLIECINARMYCSSKAAMELAAWYQKNENDTAAESYYKTAWCLNPERPEPCEKLWQLAVKNKKPQEQVFYERLKQLVIRYLHLNRSANANRELAALLLDHEWNREALSFAYNAYIVGRKEYANTLVFHRALQKNALSYPDYETIILPGEHANLSPEEQTQRFPVETGECIAFSYLQLNPGMYRLRWNQYLATDTVEYAFSLDGKNIGTQKYTKDDKSQPGEIVFTALYNNDFLQINAHSGKSSLSNLILQRIQASVPILDETGEISVKTEGSKNFIRMANLVAGLFRKRIMPHYIFIFLPIHGRGM